MRWTDRLAALLMAAALLAACNHVRYQEAGKPPPEDGTPFDRTVSYHVARAFYSDPPRCAVVLPPETPAGDATRIRTVEAAVARHLGHRLDRVIGPDRREAMARDLAVDLRTPEGRRRFAALARCDSTALIETAGPESTFALVWAQARLALTVKLVRSSDGAELWRASHEARRSEGSLPLSLVGIPVGAFQAGRFQSDADVFPSMADDVARRIMASLPDTRSLGGQYRAQR